ncbi:hypothetical protein L1049_028363 [Liquidambar formosana]|uniref:Uncharacterized protein n=1 Tax=Liquidambar formosana TaxID=63359 RepID=A0AAP0WWX6_LIQFO
MSSMSKSPSNTSTEEDVELRRGPWTLEEDNLLIHYIACHSEGRWNLLAKRSGLRRTGKSCRLRWLNYLKPDVKRGNLTPQEQLLILELHSKWGNRWSKIAQHLPGRTDNEIKNYWRTRVQKQARHLKIDSNSTAFQDMIRCYWMPRLYQKIERSSPSSTMSSQNSVMPQPLDYASQHYSESLPPPLPPPPPPPQPQVFAQTIHSLDHHEKTSSSNNCSTSPSSSSLESMNTSQVLPQVSEYPTNPCDAITNYKDHNRFLKDGSCVDNSSYSYDMESFSLASILPTGDLDNLVGDGNLAESNWVDNDLGDSLWMMDELWQFRKFQERGN